MESNFQRDDMLVVNGGKEPPEADRMASMIFEDICAALNIRRGTPFYQFLFRAAKRPALQFAEVLRSLDRDVTQYHLWDAAAKALTYFTDGWRVRGQERIPREGPLLVVANHPGSADSVGAIAALHREDVRVIAGVRPMLQVLPHVRKHIVFLDSDMAGRMGAIRDVIRLLRQGDSVLIFPRGSLEPDPSLNPGARDSIRLWSDSVGLFLNKVPETVLQPLLISHVVTPKAWHNPLAFTTRADKRRHQIAMIWQFAMQRASKKLEWRIPMRIEVGQPVTARDLSPTLDPHELNEGTRAIMSDLLLQTFPDCL